MDETIYVIPQPISVVVVQEAESVLVVEDVPDVVIVATPGPQGPPGPIGIGIQGPPGPPGADGHEATFQYVHDQAIPAASWLIVHNLGGFPNVTVVDSTDREVVGVVEYDTDDQLRAVFESAFGGKAYLS